MISDFFHRLFGTFHNAFAALYAKGIVYDRIAVGVLRYRTDRTCFYQGAHVVVRADGFVYFYHVFLFANLEHNFRFSKFYAYLCIASAVRCSPGRL